MQCPLIAKLDEHLRQVRPQTGASPRVDRRQPAEQFLVAAAPWRTSDSRAVSKGGAAALAPAPLRRARGPHRGRWPTATSPTLPGAKRSGCPTMRSDQTGSWEYRYPVPPSKTRRAWSRPTTSSRADTRRPDRSDWRSFEQSFEAIRQMLASLCLVAGHGGGCAGDRFAGKMRFVDIDRVTQLPREQLHLQPAKTECQIVGS